MAKAKKPAAKSVVKKSTAPKPAAKKPASKPAAKKPAAKVEAKKAPVKPEAKKPTAKVEAKKPAAKPEAPKADAKKLDAKKPELKKPEVKKPEVKKPEVKPAAAPAPDESKSGRKGITIVQPKPMMKKPKPKLPTLMPPGVKPLLDPKNPLRRPLIPSGPNAKAQVPLGMQGSDAGTVERMTGKSPFAKKELDKYREMLQRKRSELLGDITAMEDQALQGGSGSLSHTPQHIAEQGSETYDQALALDLAAADRKLLKEIEDAIKRIDAGTYGICELTGKPIKAERLDELPWARYTIEAARELERRSMRI
ncbi:MAG: TraR/DksA C4-type zinc finger protein [Planctomycetota bacterium]|nr:TraR/DksA C4-type zinc finger protein [Planctomycetota bacterium]